VSNEDLQAHLRALGLGGEVVTGASGARFIVAAGYVVTKGSLAGTRCDVAVQWSDSTPYIPAPAIHTRPALVAMGTRNTQGSDLGQDWQYWSRRMVAQPTPKSIMAHIATVLGEI
jgi:hypothetical protein